MINRQMKHYSYSTFNTTKDSYGQHTLVPVAYNDILMAINFINETIDENSLYSGAQYLGLTSAPVNDSYVINFGDEKLKVLYVNPNGRLKQVFMARM